MSSIKDLLSKIDVIEEEDGTLKVGDGDGATHIEMGGWDDGSQLLTDVQLGHLEEQLKLIAKADAEKKKVKISEVDILAKPAGKWGDEKVLFLLNRIREGMGWKVAPFTIEQIPSLIPLVERVQRAAQVGQVMQPSKQRQQQKAQSDAAAPAAKTNAPAAAAKPKKAAAAAAAAPVAAPAEVPPAMSPNFVTGFPVDAVAWQGRMERRALHVDLPPVFLMTDDPAKFRVPRGHQVDPSRPQGCAPTMPSWKLFRQYGNPYPVNPNDPSVCPSEAKYRQFVLISYYTFEYLNTNKGMTGEDRAVIDFILRKANVRASGDSREAVYDTCLDLALYGFVRSQQVIENGKVIDRFWFTLTPAAVAPSAPAA